ncbi:tail fiber protein [Colwellia sp. E2M01]|uniref:phage tail protein n=1 Tax=Colwellia sp. E2M01 TaxID=2841561 RepID=UPI001C08B4CE|nr:tail fiber protein [Colwellia sp. E2M01]MBU2871896.1 tail fiber protein [Colwellia sp. E2M01]
MSEAFLGEIRMFAGNFAPRQWAFCDGQILAISQNDALFSLLGTTYGGDGITLFALPDMRGRLPVHQGTGPGLTNKFIGAHYGSERVTLTSEQMPTHKHEFKATVNTATASDPTNSVLAAQIDGDMSYYSSTTPPATTQLLSQNTVSSVGGGQSHSNLMPSLCLNFIIAMFGTYPSRN